MVNAVVKYQKYAEYKDSGIEWLGEIPSHWISTSLKRYVSVTDGSHHSPKIESEGMPFVSVTDVGINTIDFENAKKISASDYLRLVKEGCKPLVGDVLLTKDGTIGRACIVTAEMPDFVVLSSLGLLTPVKDVDSEYLYYYLVSGINVDQMNSVIHGSALRRMTISKIDDLVFILPSNTEQQAIANFLDHETSKIDSLIEKQQKLIELLKEKRQAVISHAVTKGLNPDVAIKDSGVEWLGQVPEHWEIPKLLHVTVRIGDGLHSTPMYADGTGYYFINGNNLVDGEIIIGGTAKEVPESEFYKHKVELNSSSVFLSINGTIGKVALYNNESVILGKSAAYINCQSVLVPSYLANYLTTSEARNYYDLEVTGTTIYNLSLNSIRNMKVPLPPINEQSKIIDYIGKQLEKYDRLIQTAINQTELLQERRTALISSAVTGKIDVRNWQNPQQDLAV